MDLAWLWQTLLASGIGGAVGSLVSTWLTTHLQHRYWRRARYVDEKLRVLREFNRLAADFFTEHVDAEKHQRPVNLSNDFFRDLQVLKAEIKARFSTKAYCAYLKVEKVIPNMSDKGTDEFIRERDAVMEILVDETS
jgi:hypothetical protein